MMARPNPISPPPVIVPSSVCVNPNWLPQSSRISTPRTEKPMPAAISVKKLAQNRILSLALGDDAGAGEGAVLTYRLRARVCRELRTTGLGGVYQPALAGVHEKRTVGANSQVICSRRAGYPHSSLATELP